MDEGVINNNLNQNQQGVVAPQVVQTPVGSANRTFKFAIVNAILLPFLFFTAWFVDIIIVNLVIKNISDRYYEGKLTPDLIKDIVLNESVVLAITILIPYLFVIAFLFLKFPKVAKILLILLTVITVLYSPVIFMQFLYGGPMVLAPAIIGLSTSFILFFYSKKPEQFSFKSLFLCYLFLFFFSLSFFLINNYHVFDFVSKMGVLNDIKETEIKKENTLPAFGKYEFTYFSSGIKNKNEDFVRFDPNTDQPEVEQVYECQYNNYIPNDFDLRGKSSDDTYIYFQNIYDKLASGSAMDEFSNYEFSGKVDINGQPGYYFGSAQLYVDKNQIWVFFKAGDKYWDLRTYSHCFLPESKGEAVNIVEDLSAREKVIEEVVKMAKSLSRN